MSTRTMLVLAAVSMLASSVAWAQSAPAPAGDQTAPMPGMHRPMNDPVAWHKERCVNHYAGLAGKLAFLEAKLDLTDAQRPAWSAWRQARIDDAVKERDSCLADVPPQPHGPPTILEGEARMEKMLSARLAGLQARRPALEALYAALTPEQKAILDRMGGRHGHHHDADLHHDGQDHDGDGH